MADNRDFINASDQHIGCIQGFGKGLWILRHGVGQQFEDSTGGLVISSLAGIGRQSKQLLGHHGIARWGHIILQVARADNQRFMVVAGVIKAAAVCLKMFQRNIGQATGLDEPFFIKGKLIQFQQGVDEISIIFQIAVELALPLPMTAIEAAAAVNHGLQQKFAGAFGRGGIVTALEGPRGFG